MRDEDLERTLWRKARRLIEEARVAREEASRLLEVARRLDEQVDAVHEDLRAMIDGPGMG